ncbi:restriction endonuclease subunit S [Segatella copri]|uniref:restriction endonuclease subunit S n=1 Tax=Segatella copri TaxID=165179 RepID=UPI00294B88CA|nr:restriction endonuclease subunit S [Segatella copri]
MEWKEVRLGDVCSELSDGLHKAPKFIVNGEYIFVNAKNLYNGYILDNDPTKKTSHEEYLKYKKPLGKHSILYSIDGTIGNIAKYRGEKCVLGKGACYINCNPEIVESSYLYYQLQSPHFKSYIHLMSTGSTIKHISLKTMRDYVFELPSLEDQRHIASILSSLDRKIELNNKINADLEEMAQAIFKNWFVDFEPFKDGKFVDSELGMIPEGWKVGSPYEYVKVVYGAPYKSAKFNDNGEGLPLIRIRDLKDCNPQFYTPEILPQTEYVNMGDIVAGMDAEFVPHIWKGNTGLLNQRVCKLMPQQTSISNLFVLYLMKPELEFVQSYKTGTTVSHLGKADIDKFVVVLPPLKVVEECSKILDSILQRIKNISAESRNLSTLRDTLLPRLMSGELEVPE